MQGNEKIILTNAQVYTGDTVLIDHAVMLSGSSIEAIIPTNQIPDNNQCIDLQGNILTTGFIDFQLYGGDTAFFVKDLSLDSLENIVATHLQDGTTGVVPTLYSTTLDSILTAIDITKFWIASGRGGVLGIHIEGPFLNIEKRGAHGTDMVRIPTRFEVESIIERSKGIPTVMTIAPEIWPADLLELVQNSHLILSIGHSNASAAEATQFFKKIGLVTHLYNAMRPFESREIGMVGAVFDDPSVSASIIVDGFHCDFAAVRIAKELLQERLFLISDASFAKFKQKRFEFGSFSANYDGQRFLNDDGKLAGSAITLLDAVTNCVEKVGISKAETFRMASLYPAQHLGLANQFGRIAAGYRADLLEFTPDLNLKTTWKDGKQK